MVMDERERVLRVFGKTGGFPRAETPQYFDSYTTQTIQAIEKCLQDHLITSTIHDGTTDTWLVPTRKGVRCYLELTD